MKLSRRNFLALGAGVAAGGAVGTMLSPLPFKLADDLSIWTQNWPGTPAVAGGPETALDTVCRLCPGSCGLRVRKIGERLAGVAGTPGHPVNDGGLCPLGASALALLYGPTRITGPMVNAGKRGEGKWKRVSWKEAVEFAAKKLSDLRAKGDAHRAGVITGQRLNPASRMFERFLQAFGSSNVFFPVTSFDTYAKAIKYMHGVDAQPGFDIENADFVLSFGSDLLEGFGSPVSTIKAVSALRDRGGVLVQVSPRLSNTAAKADQWIAAKPGSEAALALGIAHVLIKEKLADPGVIAAARGFLDAAGPDGKLVKGFSGKVLADYTPEKVAGLTGLSAKAITDLARAFGKAEKPLAVWGRGRGDGAGLLSECMAVHSLNILKGRINAQGGLFLRREDSLAGWSAPFLDQVAIKGLSRGRADFAGTRRFPLAESILSNLPALLAETRGGGLSALLVVDSDPFHDLADAKKAREVFGKIPFIASFATHLNDTAMMSDVVFPANFFLEDWQYSPTPPGSVKRQVSLSKPLLNPVVNSRPAGEAIMEIARAVGGTVGQSFAWANFSAALAQALGNDMEALKNDGHVSADAIVEPGAGVDFSPAVTHRFIHNALVLGPTHKGPDLPGKGDWPLLAVPIESLRLAVGPVAGSNYMVKALSDAVLKKNGLLVEVNPETAKKLGLSEGSVAELSTPKGSASVMIHLSNGIMPGVVGIPRGLGHQGYDAFLNMRGVNYSALAAPAIDPVTGQDAAYGVRASLSPWPSD